MFRDIGCCRVPSWIPTLLPIGFEPKTQAGLPGAAGQAVHYRPSSRSHRDVQQALKRAPSATQGVLGPDGQLSRAAARPGSHAGSSAASPEKEWPWLAKALKLLLNYARLNYPADLELQITG